MDSPTKDAICGVLGQESNTVVLNHKDIKDLDVPIVTPIPKLEGIHPGGVDISWEIPEEQADVMIAVSYIHDQG